MGLFSNLFGKKKQVDESKLTLADYLNAFPPIFSKGDVDVLKNDIFRAGVACITREMRKIYAEHVRLIDGEDILQNSSINYVLSNPNPIMTAADFFEKITFITLTQENCFIYPVYEGGELIALYPLEPSGYKFVERKGSDELDVQFYFQNGQQRRSIVIDYNLLIHIRRNFTLNEYAGGNLQGQFDDTGVRDVVELNDFLADGLKKQVQTSYASHIILNLKSTYDKEKEKEAIRVFEEKLNSSKSAVLATGLDTQITSLNRALNFVDTELVKYIETKVLRPLGVSVAILSGDYSKQQYEAFFQSALEPLLVTFSQAFTRGLFTRKELGYKNKIKFHAEEAAFLSTAEKLEVIRLLGDQGGIFINEARALIGLRTAPELKNKLMQSLNYISAQNASKYQVGDDKETENDVDENTDKPAKKVEKEEKE